MNLQINKIPHIKPMLATLIDKPFDSSDWIFEIKWDGYRAIAEIIKNKVSLYSRNDKSFNDLFPPVVKSLQNISFNIILDGEIVIVDNNGKSDFQLLQQYFKNGTGILIYYVFDLLFFHNQSLLNIPLTQRKKKLFEIFSIRHNPESKEKITMLSNIKLSNIRVSDHIETAGIDFFKAAVDNGLEGIMAKKKDSLYEPGIRSRNWLKIKVKQRQEVVIGGFTAPKGSRKKIGSLVAGIYEGKNLIFVGHVGGGLNEQELDELKSKLDTLVINKSPFNGTPKSNTPVQWVKPSLVAEVEFSEWTQDYIMRQPVFLGLRTDKAPIDVHLEKPEKMHNLRHKNK